MQVHVFIFIKETTVESLVFTKRMMAEKMSFSEHSNCYYYLGAPILSMLNLNSGGFRGGGPFRLRYQSMYINK